MSDLSIFKLDTQTINIKDTTARQTADSAKTLATTASGNATTALNIVTELESEKADAIISSTSGAIASFPDGAESTAKKLVVSIEPVQKGTGDPSPDNVRPISGWTGAKVTRTGKNLLWKTRQSSTMNGITWTLNDDGSITASGTSTGRSYIRIIINSRDAYTLPKGTYTYSLNPTGSDYKEIKSLIGSYKGTKYYRNVCIADNSHNFAGVFEWNDSDLTATLDIAVEISQANQTVNCTVYPQIEIGTTATAYEPYQGETYPITFPSSAGTVYGGTLDVTTGVLTVDRAQIASYNGETLPGKWISDRDVYAAGASPTTGAQVVYKLATPVTYQLTPTEIRTLLGQNNVWADTGDISVTYRADMKLYIDKKFTELQALILEN